MPDDHPLSVAAARTLALQNADVVFLMGARFNWIFHFGRAPRYAKDMKVIQLDIAPKRSATTRRPRWPCRPTDRAGGPPEDRLWQGDPAYAGTGQLNGALAVRQWFHPKDTPWRQMITKKS